MEINLDWWQDHGRQTAPTIRHLRQNIELISTLVLLIYFGSVYIINKQEVMQINPGWWQDHAVLPINQAKLLPSHYALSALSKKITALLRNFSVCKLFCKINTEVYFECYIIASDKIC
jgi:hypothetical protein